MKKILALIAVFFVLLSAVFPLASASYVCPAAWTDTPDATFDCGLFDVHPSDHAHPGDSVVGEMFTPNATCYLYNASFYISKMNDPTGTIQAVLFAYAGGTMGTNAYTTGSIIDVSTEAMNVADIPSSATWITFEFDGLQLLNSSTNYGIALEIVSGSGFSYSTSHYVRLWDKSGLANANTFYYEAGSWGASGTTDILFIINGDTDADPDPTTTPSPTPTATASSGDGGDADMENLMDAVLPFLVPLLICLIPAFLGLKYVGEMGFFIGLNIGVILAYITLAGTAYAFPLWGIILVGVMDVVIVMMRR